MASPIASTSRNVIRPAIKTSAVGVKILSRSAAVVPNSLQIRAPPKAPYRGPLSKKDRVYPSAKTTLFDKHANLLERSQLVIFIRYDKLSTKELNRLRADVQAIPGGNLRLHVIRPTLLPPVLRMLRHLPVDELQRHLSGSIAVVTAESVDPPAISAFLRLFKQHAKTVNVAPAAPPQAKGAKAGPLKAAVQDRLVLLSAILEARQDCDATGLGEIAKLPSLPLLQSQIVGLIQQSALGLVTTLEAASQGTGQKLVGLLQQASGGQLVRTVDGHRRTLEAEAGASSPDGK